MRNLFPLTFSLVCCLIFYVAIWKKFPRKWTGINKMHNSPTKSPFQWNYDRNFTKQDVAKSRTLTLNAPTKKITKETLKSLQNVKSNLSVLSTNYSKIANATVLPVLFKKAFKKLPAWGIGDVYIQNGDERLLGCSKSLQKSRDKHFQAAAIWNIQLWLFKGHLSISEWNRLAHFNNPYGFMEYNYEDIKPTVDLIPKPKSMQLLPVPESASDGCVRCAVVGTGGILRGSRMGQEIDSHHYVFRVNGAVTKGYEEDVGNKTSVYVHTSFGLRQSVLRLKKYGFKYSPNDKGIKYVLIPEGLRDFEWIQGLLKKTRVMGHYKGSRPFSFYGDQFEEDRFYVLHPDFLRYIRNRFLPSKTLNGTAWYFYRPTNGAFTLFLALHTCDVVDVYGFITEDHRKYSNYYYDRAEKTKVVFFINHDYNLEIQTWKRLHDSGIINLYQRKENQNQTVS